MPRGEIVWDQSGEWRLGHFFEVRMGIEYGAESTEPFIRLAYEKEWEPVATAGFGTDYESHREYECPINPVHPTRTWQILGEVDIPYRWRGEGVFSTFDDFVVAPRVADAIRQENLSGIEIREVKCSAETLEVQGADFRAFSLLIQGGYPLRLPRVIPAAENYCPFCGYRPLVCTGCKNWLHFHDCTNRQGTAIKRDADLLPNDTDVLVWRMRNELLDLVDPVRWDGSDFMCHSHHCIVTARALEVLIRSEAWPLTAWPLRTLLSDTPQEHLDRLPPVHPAFAGKISAKKGDQA